MFSVIHIAFILHILILQWQQLFNRFLHFFTSDFQWLLCNFTITSHQISKTKKMTSLFTEIYLYHNMSCGASPKAVFGMQHQSWMKICMMIFSPELLKKYAAEVLHGIYSCSSFVGVFDMAFSVHELTDENCISSSEKKFEMCNILQSVLEQWVLLANTGTYFKKPVITKWILFPYKHNSPLWYFRGVHSPHWVT